MSRELVAHPTGARHHIGVRQGHTDACPACQLDELGDEYKAWFAANHYTPAHELTRRAQALINAPLAHLPAEHPKELVPAKSWPQAKPVQLPWCRRCSKTVDRATQSRREAVCRCGRRHYPIVY